MSMLGVRDLSVIETPPENRFPVQTYVLEQNTNFIKEALGVNYLAMDKYFICITKCSPFMKKEQLQMLMPDANIAVAHGQMTERDLEKQC